MKILNVINSPWAIQPEKLLQIRDIYISHLNRDKIDKETIKAASDGYNNEYEGPEVIDGVAIIQIRGPIAQRMNLMTRVSGGTSSELVARDFTAAIKDESVRAIILSIDSPGGTVHGTQELAELIYAARGVKPVVAWTDAGMMSAAYWIGSAASAIYISGDTNPIGSIGVVTAHVDVSKAEEKLGIKTTEITAGKFKRVASSYEPLSEIGRATIQERLDYLYAVFIEKVAMHRGVSEEVVLANMADGRIFIGKQAIKAGLVDGVSTLEDLIAALSGDSPDSITMKPPAAGVVAGADERTGNSMTLAELKEKHPDVYKAACDEAAKAAAAPHEKALADAVAAARAEGAEAERKRIQDVESKAMPGHEDLIAGLKYDGKTTGPEAADVILTAVRKREAAAGERIAADAEAVAKVPNTPAGEDEPAVSASEKEIREALGVSDEDVQKYSERGRK